MQLIVKSGDFLLLGIAIALQMMLETSGVSKYLATLFALLNFSTVMTQVFIQVIFILEITATLGAEKLMLDG